MLRGYAELLRVRYVGRLLTGTLIGRLPNAAAAFAIVLFVRAEGGSYTLGGILSGGYGLATAVGQPLLGRAVDLRGQPRVLLPSALLSAAGMALFAVVGIEPLPLACAAVLVAGLFTPPLEGALRALWPSVLKRPDRVHGAYALDAVAQEVMFAVAPLIVTVLAGTASEAAALLVLNALGVLGALWVVLSPPARRWRSEPREAHWLGALRAPGLQVVLGAFFFVGVALGGTAVASVAYADARGGDAIGGYLLSALGAGALVGGVVYGARQWPGRAERRLQLLLAGLAVGYLPLTLTPGPAAMTLLSGVAGLFLAPALACSFVVIDRHAPRGTATEAFSWLVTTFGFGAAAGTAVTGPAVEYGGETGGFAVVGFGGAAALLVLTGFVRILARTGHPRPAVEKDRIGGAAPGFETERQA